jgi:hypothetical protein
MSDSVQTPRDIGAERRLLGAQLLFPDRADEMLWLVEPRDYADEFHQKLWQHLRDQHRNGGIDVARIRSELKVPDTTKGDFTKDYLDDLKAEVITSVHAPADAERIIEARRKRQRWEHHHTLANHALNGYTIEQLDEENESALYDWKCEREATKPQTMFTQAELRARFPRLNTAVVNGWCRESETINVIAPSKFGKSWLLYYLFLCIVSGRPIFDRFDVSAGPCWIFDNELHGSTLAHRIDAVAEAMGLPRAEFEYDLHIRPLRGNLPSLADLEHELSECDLEPASVRAFGFDALYRIMPAGSSENDNAAMTQVYNLLDRIGDRTRAANFVIHHSSKGSQSDRRLTDVGSGAGAQSRAADCHLILREHEEPGVAVLEAAVRSFAPVEPLALRWQFPLWVPDSYVDPSKLRGKQTASEQRQDDRDREGINKIVDALRQGPGTARSLRGRTGLSRERQQRLLDKLQAEKQIITTETTIRGNPTSEYSLPENNPY